MLQQNPGWFNILILAYTGCLSNWLLKQVLLNVQGKQLSILYCVLCICMYNYLHIGWPSTHVLEPKCVISLRTAYFVVSCQSNYPICCLFCRSSNEHGDVDVESATLHSKFNVTTKLLLEMHMSQWWANLESNLSVKSQIFYADWFKYLCQISCPVVSPNINCFWLKT